MTTPRLRIPRALEARVFSLSVVVAGVAACSESGATGTSIVDASASEVEQVDVGGAPGDAVAEADTEGPTIDAEGDAPSDALADSSTPDGADAVADAGLRACIQSVGEGGVVDLTYFDGGLVGYEIMLADGGSEVLLLDGGFGGNVVTDDAGMQWVEDAGPCDYFV